MPHIMIDLETLGLTPDAVVLSLGAVEFHPNVPGTGREFYVQFDVPSQMRAGRRLDFATIQWWMEQKDDARRYAFLDNRYPDPMSLSLERFHTWLGTDQAYFWGNGAAFDNVLLKSLYGSCGARAPWRFDRDRCYRTIVGLKPEIKRTQLGTHHHPIDDCKSQILHMQEVVKALGLEFPKEG